MQDLDVCPILAVVRVMAMMWPHINTDKLLRIFNWTRDVITTMYNIITNVSYKSQLLPRQIQSCRTYLTAANFTILLSSWIFPNYLKWTIYQKFLRTTDAPLLSAVWSIEIHSTDRIRFISTNHFQLNWRQTSALARVKLLDKNWRHLSLSTSHCSYLM